MFVEIHLSIYFIFRSCNDFVFFSSREQMTGWWFKFMLWIPLLITSTIFGTCGFIHVLKTNVVVTAPELMIVNLKSVHRMKSCSSAMGNFFEFRSARVSYKIVLSRFQLKVCCCAGDTFFKLYGYCLGIELRFKNVLLLSEKYYV